MVSLIPDRLVRLLSVSAKLVRLAGVGITYSIGDAIVVSDTRSLMTPAASRRAALMNFTFLSLS